MLWERFATPTVYPGFSFSSPSQTPDPLRGIYDAIVRPDRWSTSRGEAISPTGEQEDASDDGEPIHEQCAVTAAEASTSTATASMVSTTCETEAMRTVTETQMVGQELDKTGMRKQRGVQSFLPEEKLTLEEAIWMYTAGGAFAAGEENRLGALRPGYSADFTVAQVEGGVESLMKVPRYAE